MTEEFNIAFNDIMGWEKSTYTNHPNDRGGPTKYGISLRFMQLINPNATTNDIKNLTEEEAKKIYFTYFWIQYRIDEVKEQSIAIKMLNMFVNLQPIAAGRIMQVSVNQVSKLGLTVDGVIGPKSLGAINTCNPDILLAYIKLNLITHYERICAVDESQKVHFLGWVRRALA